MDKQQEITNFIKENGLLREVERYQTSRERNKPGDYWITDCGKFLRLDYAPIGEDGTIYKFEVFQ